MEIDVLRQNDTYVSQLRHAISEGGAGLSDVPALLKCVLRDDRWQKRRIKTGDEPKFERFEVFVATPPLEGLGTDMDLIKRLCAGDMEAMTLLDKALERSEGKRAKRTSEDTVNNGNSIEPRPQGNTQRQAIRKLGKDRPDLHARVLAKELSPHAAMIEAGFRKPSITLPLDPESAARLIRKHFVGEAFVELMRLLSSSNGSPSQ